MAMHLRPVEFINALEKVSLSGRATGHLRVCPQCRETLRDLQDSQRTFRWRSRREIDPDAAFWEGFTQGVHRIVQRWSSTSGEPWRPRASAMILVFSCLLLFGISTSNFQWQGGPGSGEGVPDWKPEANYLGSGIAFGILTPELYLYPEFRYDERLRQDLSTLQLGPGIWGEDESGRDHSTE